jgi:hypothetical protein
MGSEIILEVSSLADFTATELADWGRYGGRRRWTTSSVSFTKERLFRILNG